MKAGQSGTSSWTRLGVVGPTAAGLAPAVALVFYIYGFFRTTGYGMNGWGFLSFPSILGLIAVPVALLAFAIVRFVMVRGGLATTECGPRFCTRCSYPAEGLSAEECPECASTNFRPKPPPLVAWREARWLALAAWLASYVGAAGAELHAGIEEAAFRSEAAAHAPGFWGRARWWPFESNGLVVNKGLIHATD